MISVPSIKGAFDSRFSLDRTSSERVSFILKNMISKLALNALAFLALTGASSAASVRTQTNRATLQSRVSIIEGLLVEEKGECKGWCKNTLKNVVKKKETCSYSKCSACEECAVAKNNENCKAWCADAVKLKHNDLKKVCSWKDKCGGCAMCEEKPKEEKSEKEKPKNCQSWCPAAVEKPGNNLKKVCSWKSSCGDCDMCTSDPCLNDPCENSGTCEVVKGGKFKCTCLPGFAGDKCEDNIDDCVENPCENGGTCIDEVNGHSCECAEGFTGKNCEDEIPAGEIITRDPSLQSARDAASAAVVALNTRGWVGGGC